MTAPAGPEEVALQLLREFHDEMGYPGGLDLSQNTRGLLPRIAAALGERDRSARAAAIEEAARWQPIETAPKDGTYILVAGRKEVARVQAPAADDGPYVDICNFSHGQWSIVWMHGHREPTHWMPLPKPPATALRALGEAP